MFILILVSFGCQKKIIVNQCDPEEAAMSYINGSDAFGILKLKFPERTSFAVEVRMFEGGGVIPQDCAEHFIENIDKFAERDADLDPSLTMEDYNSKFYCNILRASYVYYGAADGQLNGFCECWY